MIPRRGTFLLVAAALAAPLILPFEPPGAEPTPEARAVHDRIEALPPFSRVLVSFDFDPSSQAELEPQARAVLGHLFRRGHLVYALGLADKGRGLARRILTECAAEAHRVEGEDFVDLGWQPGGPAVILAMGEDIPRTFPRDARGLATADLVIMRGVLFLGDLNHAVAFCQRAADLEAWITYGRIRMSAGTSAVNAAAVIPFLQSRQLDGLLVGIRGASDYEGMRGLKGQGTAGLASVALGSLAVAGLAALAALLGMRRGKEA